MDKHNSRKEPKMETGLAVSFTVERTHATLGDLLIDLECRQAVDPGPETEYFICAVKAAMSYLPRCFICGAPATPDQPCRECDRILYQIESMAAERGDRHDRP